MMRFVRRCSVLLAITAALALTAHADTIRIVGAGPRAGLSVTPDQLVLGGQLSMSVAPEWTVDPNLELGFGDGESDWGVNFDALYHARLANSDWRPYVGGGLGINTVSVDLPAPFRDLTDTGLGVNAVLGFTVPSKAGHLWFTELRVGIGDFLPDLKLIGGINFNLK
jgi:hypothetical protein